MISRLRSERGFTLIEMLIVIAVIAILAGIVITGVSGIQASARDTKRIGELRGVQTNLEGYFAKCGHYPNGQTCGTVGSGAAEITPWSTLQTTLGGRIAQDPLPSKTYEYGYTSGGLGYILKATLENDNASLKDPLEIETSGISTVDCTDTATNFFFCITSD